MTPYIVIRPQGVTNPPMPSETPMIKRIALADFVSNQVVMSDGRSIKLSQVTTEGEVLGFMARDCWANSLASIQTSGELWGFVGLIPGEPIYMANDGMIVQVKPTRYVVQSLGIALSENIILINIQPPIPEELFYASADYLEGGYSVES
jgi:hypothetical protein